MTLDAPESRAPDPGRDQPDAVGVEPELPDRSPGLAAALSIIPGCGHLYLGRPRRGAIIFVSSLLVVLSVELTLHPLLAFPTWWLAAYGASVDARRAAHA